MHPVPPGSKSGCYNIPGRIQVAEAPSEHWAEKAWNCLVSFLTGDLQRQFGQQVAAFRRSSVVHSAAAGVSDAGF